jgi:hypothetical protein
MAENFQIVQIAEKKVIRIGSYFFKLKGYLVKEADEDEKKKYYCGKYMTYPIVDDDFKVMDDDDITDGIEMLVIGCEGDTVPLAAIHAAAEDNAVERNCDFADIMVNLERHGITLSNRVAYDSEEEFPDEVVVCLDPRVMGIDCFRLDPQRGSYYLPQRFCYIKDGELYMDYRDDKKNENPNEIDKIYYQLAEELWNLAWFFNKKNLHIRVKTYTPNGYSYGFGPNELADITDEWPDCIKRLESQVNEKFRKMCEEYPNDYFKGKRKDVPKTKRVEDLLERLVRLHEGTPDDDIIKEYAKVILSHCSK